MCALATLVTVVAVSGPSQAFVATLNLHGEDGEGSITAPGRPCSAGGSGGHWHYDYGTLLDPGIFSSLPGEARLHLDLHSENDGPHLVSPVLNPGYDGSTAGAFLQGEQSHLSLMNQRGAIKLRLKSGDCNNPSLAFDGRSANGSGTWTVDRGVGAYRNSAGGGTFDVTAQVRPGSNNTFDLQLGGSIEVRRATLTTQFDRAYWGSFGADYALPQPRPTVVVKVTNPSCTPPTCTETGDGFGARLVAASSPTAGVTVVGFAPQYLGDLHSGESELARLKFQIDRTKVCQLVLLGCAFDVALEFTVLDALDEPSTVHGTIHARAPDLPPPAT